MSGNKLIAFSKTSSCASYILLRLVIHLSFYDQTTFIVLKSLSISELSKDWINNLPGQLSNQIFSIFPATGIGVFVVGLINIAYQSTLLQMIGNGFEQNKSVDQEH